MGRAKGMSAAVSVGIAAPRRQNTRPATLLDATTRLRLLFTDRRKLRSRLEPADELCARRLADMLNSQLPAEWAFDTALADAAPTLRDRKTEAALIDYLRARLLGELPELVAEGWLDDEVAQTLQNPTRPDHYLTWAALRAVDLLRESKRLREFSDQGDEEYRRATLAVSERCETIARRDLADPPTDVCAEAAVALALASGLTRGGQDSAVYHGLAERHRQLVQESSGREVSAPIIVSDWWNLGAVRGQAELYATQHGSSAPAIDGGGHEVWLNQRRLNAEQERYQDYSLTLTHELIHGLQGDANIFWDDDQTVAEQELNELLREGATESQTRLLLRDQITEFEEGIYEDRMAFVTVLADLAAEGDRERASAFVAQLAYCSDVERPQLAADLVCDGRLDDLTAAGHTYAKFAFGEETHSTVALRGWARVLLHGARDGTMRPLQEQS